MNSIVEQIQENLKGEPTPSDALPYLVVRQYPDEALRRVCSPFLDPIEGNTGVQDLFSMMEKTMKAYGALGLAGPQVGIFYRFLCIRNKDDVITMINPRVTSRGAEENGVEGCLSFPGLTMKVRRPVVVTAEYTDRQGKQQKVTLYGAAARALEHEIDHLDGKTFLDRVPVFYRRGALQRMRTQQRQIKSQHTKVEAAMASLERLKAKRDRVQTRNKATAGVK